MLSRHWYDALRACGMRQRGLYCTKDSFVTTALQAGVKIAWLEQQTGANYATLRRHYGKWMPIEGETELRRFAAFDADLFPGRIVPPSSGKIREREMRGGGLEPPRVISPLAPQTSASASSAILARPGGGRVT